MFLFRIFIVKIRIMRRYILIIVACLLYGPYSFGATVITYPATEGVEPSSDYTISVSGREVFVYDSPAASYAMFDFEGEIEVVISTPRVVKWVDVRPKRLGIRPLYDDHSIRITLDHPCNLSIELNGEFSNRPLFLFANPPEEERPDRNDPGVIYFEGGKVHRPGLIELKSNQTVYIEGGAVVEGVIHGKDVAHVKVQGRGILDGTRNRQYSGEVHSRFVEFQDSRDILIEGIVLEDSHMWEIVPIHCEGVTVDNVKIISDNGSDDGIDIVRSKNVTVTRCFIRTKDDCIAVKSAWDYPGSEGSEDITVSQCVFWNAAWGNGIEIGFELRSDYVRNIVFRDSDVIHVEDGAVFSIHNGDRSVVEHITFEDLYVEDARQKLFDLAIFLSQYSLDRPDDPEARSRRYQRGPWDGVLTVPDSLAAFHSRHRGQIRNVLFRNIHVTDGILPFSIINGFDEAHQVEHVTFEHITVHGRRLQDIDELRLYRKFADNIRVR
jgi:hypothetical protein